MAVELYGVSAVVLLTLQLPFCEQRCSYPLSQTGGCCLYASVIPKASVDETLQQLGAALHKEALYAAPVKVIQYLLKVLLK